VEYTRFDSADHLPPPG
jgi:ubiquitin C-terminal hydrolase